MTNLKVDRDKLKILKRLGSDPGLVMNFVETNLGASEQRAEISVAAALAENADLTSILRITEDVDLMRRRLDARTNVVAVSLPGSVARELNQPLQVDDLSPFDVKSTQSLMHAVTRRGLVVDHFPVGAMVTDKNKVYRQGLRHVDTPRQVDQSREIVWSGGITPEARQLHMEAALHAVNTARSTHARVVVTDKGGEVLVDVEQLMVGIAATRDVKDLSTQGLLGISKSARVEMFDARGSSLGPSVQIPSDTRDLVAMSADAMRISAGEVVRAHAVREMTAAIASGESEGEYNPPVLQKALYSAYQNTYHVAGYLDKQAGGLLDASMEHLKELADARRESMFRDVKVATLVGAGAVGAGAVLGAHIMFPPLVVVSAGFSLLLGTVSTVNSLFRSPENGEEGYLTQEALHREPEIPVLQTGSGVKVKVVNTGTIHGDVNININTGTVNRY